MAQTQVTDYCSLELRTQDREETDKTPLELYERKGYVMDDGKNAKATDAAVALTSSRWGPPFDSHIADCDWGVPAYEAACRSVERQIVRALTREF